MDAPAAPILEKHKRYLEHHVPGDVFWGLGVENETYVELLAGKEVTADFLVKNQKRERYSVNYWTQYRTGFVQEAMAAWIATLPQGPNTPLRLPLLANGHTFTKCDPWGEHSTTYAVNPAPNPKWAGRTLLEVLEAAEPAVFGPAARDVWWCFDGDTVEFMTQAFRCTTTGAVVAELLEAKERWLDALRRVLATTRCESLLKGPVGWPTANHGFAVFLTNRRNVAIFNNGTYHINITAPTTLGKNGEIADWPRFLHIHRQAARLFQWLAPFLVAAFGSGDPFAAAAAAGLHSRKATTPAGSQRLAASRYVSVGNYDTRLMPRGKLLTTPVNEMTQPPTWWLQMYADRPTAYEQLGAIGYDINFNKFPNHGLEFRIFDWFTEARLGEVLEMLVRLMDRAMTVDRHHDIPFPQDSPTWRKVLGRVVWEGGEAFIHCRELRIFATVLGVPELQHVLHRSLASCYEIIRAAWNRQGRWNRGPCSSYMLLPPSEPELLTPLSPSLNHMNEETEIRPRRIQYRLPPRVLGVQSQSRLPVVVQDATTPYVPQVQPIHRGCLFPFLQVFWRRRTSRGSLR